MTSLEIRVAIVVIVTHNLDSKAGALMNGKLAQIVAIIVVSAVSVLEPSSGRNQSGQEKEPYPNEPHRADSHGAVGSGRQQQQRSCLFLN